MPPKILFKPVPATEAVEFLRSKPIVTRKVFEGLVPELRARAFLVSGITAHDRLQKLRDTVAKLPQGANYQEVKKEIAAQIRAEGSPARADLLLRHHGLQAYRVAQGRQIAAHKAVFPYLQYVATRDSRTRDRHEALNGVVLPVDDPFWKDHTPPWDWGCRCQVIQVSRARYEQLKARDASRPPEERQILDEQTRERMNRDKVLHRTIRTGAGERPGVPYTAQLHTPEDRGKTGPGSAQDLRMPLAALKQRYDGPVWASLETMLRNVPYDPRGPETLMDWLERGIAPAQHISELAWKSNVPAARVAALVREAPGHPIAEALRLWGLDDQTQAAISNPAHPRYNNAATREVRERLAQVVANIAPIADSPPVHRALSGEGARSLLASLERTGEYIEPRVLASYSKSIEAIANGSYPGADDVYLKDGGVLWTLLNPKSVRDYEPIARELGTKVWEKEVLLPEGARLRFVNKAAAAFKLDDGRVINYTRVELEEY